MNLAKVANLLDLDFEPTPQLDPTQLLGRLDRFLQAIVEIAPQISSDVLETKLPGRDRTVLQLLHHTVEVAGSISIENVETEVEQAITDSATDRSKSLLKLSRKTRLARTSFQATSTDWQSIVETPYGPQTMHQVLERGTSHIAQHIRQLEHFCGKWQRAIRGWPSHLDYEHLPLPESVWDD